MERWLVMTIDHAATEPTAAPAPKASLPVAVCALIGVGSAVLGLLPWLVTGLRLPLQNLWQAQAMPQDMPLVLLPFNQYYLALLAALLVTGGAAAGIAARALRGRLPARGFTAILLGLVAVHVVALVQTTATVAANLQDRVESALYLGVVLAAAVTGVLAAVLVLALVGRKPPGGALVGLGIGAVMLQPWLGGFVVALAGPATDIVTAQLAVRLIPPVLVGAAIAWAGIATVGRIAGAAINLLMLWLVPALLTGMSAAAGTRVLASRPAEMLEYGASVFWLSATTVSLVLRPLTIAVVVAAFGLTARHLFGRRRDPFGTAVDLPGARSST